MFELNLKNTKISVIGLGYVGLPLAVAFSHKFRVIGFDINQKRIQQINKGNDSNLEVENKVLENVLLNNDKNGLIVTSNPDELKECNVYIITVPTPVDINKKPVLKPMISATKTISKCLKKGDVVIYESTVYPGVTENEMAPLIENISGLRFNKDFFCGYSPERINPGDKVHTITKILKITSGSTIQTSNFVDELYKSIIEAGTFKASSIKVAEAAKVIENSQRDINIAFVNELSKIFNLLEIDTKEVLKAAGTKWNFLNFEPGLVGGHCIGVDPYYLAHKSIQNGYKPEIILAGRRINDSMGKFVGQNLVKMLIKRDFNLKSTKTLILGFTFKENCPDFRNTKVIDIFSELKSFGLKVDIYDPLVSSSEVFDEFQINILKKSQLNLKSYNSIIIAVAHKEFFKLKITKSESQIVYDLKGILNKKNVDARL